MKNQRIKKNKRVAVRLSDNELESLRKHARYHNQSMSAYILSCLKRNKPNVVRMGKNDWLMTNRNLAILSNCISSFRSDYSRALANLNHDNYLMNSGQLLTIPAKTFRETRNAVLKNRRSLSKIAKAIHQLGAIFWK